MGDIAAQHECGKFIKEFNEDAVKKYKISFGSSRHGCSYDDVLVSQHLGLDESDMCVRFYITLRLTGGDETVFRQENLPVFFSSWWDPETLVDQVCETMELELEEAKSRLKKAGLLDA